MAKVTLRIELDGGADVEITERSTLPIFGGPDAVLLAQEAFVKLARVYGVGMGGPVPEPPATDGPGVDTPEDDGDRKA
jgi:hypothetical protein